MMRQAEVTKIVLGVLDAFARRGLHAKGVRISVDGAIEVLTDTDSAPEAANDSSDWVARAGQKAIPRA